MQYVTASCVSVNPANANLYPDTSLIFNDTLQRTETGPRADLAASERICTRFTPLRDPIVSFSETLEEFTEDRMPDHQELYLPFFRKLFLFKIFSDECNLIYPTKRQTAFIYFLRPWRSLCMNIKFRKRSRFTKFDTCERFWVALADASVHRCGTSSIRGQIISHFQLILRERL